MNISEPKTPAEFKKYYDLRWRILRAPWNQSRGSERDQLEEKSIHLMAWGKKGIPLAVGRVHFNTLQEAQVRYMAVEENQQGKGLGGMILTGLEKRAHAQGARTVVLNSRETAVEFYKHHGYTIMGPAATMFGVIKHFKMKKML